MTQCQLCQSEIPSDSHFCDQCGARLDGEPKPHPGPARGIDRRKTKRFPVRVEVTFHSDHNFYTGFTGNISSGGLFVATHQPATIGDRLEVTFVLPGLSRPCTAACEVRWLREHNPAAPDTIAGLGLRFAELDPEARAGIDRFVSQREPIFFDDEL